MNRAQGGTAKSALLLLGTALLLLAVPVLNGYPLVYSDTGTYIRSAFEDFIPVDRPVWYGHFIRLSSFGGRTMWGVVIAQALLCASALLPFLQRAGSAMVSSGKAVALVSALTVFTGISWYVGQLMPDIFTGIGILALAHILLGDRSGSQVLWPVLLLVGSCFLHASNLLILTILAIGVALGTLRWAREFHRGAFRAVLAVAMAWVSLPVANKLATGEAGVGRGGHVFLMGRLVDADILADHLATSCATKNYAICAYHEHLPTNSQQFLWDTESPLQRMGGWEATTADYSAVVRDALTTPRYLLRFIGNSIMATAEQLTDLHMGNALLGTWYRTPDSPPYQQIERHVPHELKAYRGSVQCGEEATGRAVLHAADVLYWIGWVLAVVAFGWFVSRWSQVPMELRVMLLFVAAAVVVNAAVCAGLSVVADRFSTRMTWVLPLVLWYGRFALKNRDPHGNGSEIPSADKGSRKP